MCIDTSLPGEYQSLLYYEDPGEPFFHVQKYPATED